MLTQALRNMRRQVRKNPLVWRYVLNFDRTLAYKLRARRPSGEAARVLEELDRNGVARTSCAALFGDPVPYRELEQAVRSLELEKADELHRARRQASREDVGKKRFMVELLGRTPVFDLETAFARFALHQDLLAIANGYFRMCTRLRYYNVWHTFPTNGKARESQLWHRDREDRLILKAFVYCADVDEGGGPFTYAPGTHPKGRVRREPEGFRESDGVFRSTDDLMARLVPPDRWLQCTGPKGTIVLADTRGYHKGGECRTGDRIMYNCMYTSAASESAELLVHPPTLRLPEEPEPAYAVRR